MQLKQIGMRLLLLVFFVFSSIKCYSQAFDSIAKICISKPDLLDNAQVYTFPQQMPKYPLGEQEMIQFIQRNLKSYSTHNFQASFYVTFVIDSSGQLRNPCILKPLIKGSITPAENNIIEILNKMPKWIPGMEKGKNVNVRLNLPIKF